LSIYIAKLMHTRNVFIKLSEKAHDFNRGAKANCRNIYKVNLSIWI